MRAVVRAGNVTRTRLLCAAGIFFLLFGASGGGPAVPTPGAADWMGYQLFPVRDGTIQLSGGNLMLQYTDDSVDTLLRIPATITRTFNSATGTWIFNFQTTFLNSIFVDPNGTRYDLTGEGPGAISGSIWTLMDSTHIRTRGGLVYQFDPTDGTLQQIYWLNSSTPYMRFTKTSGVITNIDLCVALNSQCAAKFTINYSSGLVSTVTNNVVSATAATYSWQVTQGLSQITLAKNAFEYGHSLPGTRFTYTQGQGSVQPAPRTASRCRVPRTRLSPSAST